MTRRASHRTRYRHLSSLFQQNGFREGYFKGTISIHHGNQEWKADVESDSTFLREQFSDVITDFTQFDPGTPANFNFAGNRPSLEQSAFVAGSYPPWQMDGQRGSALGSLSTVGQPECRESAAGSLALFPFSRSRAARILRPGFSDSRLREHFACPVPTGSLPSIPRFLRLPVLPSHGNYYEVGLTKGFFHKLRFDVNCFDRSVNNFADDDQLLDTAVSFPIAFRKANIYGAEGKLDIPHWGRLSGFVSYSYMVGSAYLPVTGGLFLGDDATNALSQTNGRFWVSQDQRNTVRTRFRYQLVERVWVALGGEYGSGLPVEFDGTESQAVAQYGQAIVDRVNFDLGRVKPSLSIDASAGADLWKKDKRACACKPTFKT